MSIVFIVIAGVLACGLFFVKEYFYYKEMKWAWKLVVIFSLLAVLAKLAEMQQAGEFDYLM